MKVGDKVVVSPRGWFTCDTDKELGIRYPDQERYVPKWLLGKQGVIQKINEFEEFELCHYVVTFPEFDEPQMLVEDDLEPEEIYNSKLRRVLS